MDDFDLPWLRRPPSPSPPPPRRFEPLPETAEPIPPPVPIPPPTSTRSRPLPQNLPAFLSSNASVATGRTSASQPAPHPPAHGRQLLGSYITANSSPLPPNLPPRSSSSSRPPISDYEAPLPQTDSRTGHFRQQAMLNIDRGQNGNVVAVKTKTKSKTITVAMLPLSCSHPKCLQAAGEEDEADRPGKVGLGKHKIADLIDSLYLFDCTFKVTIEGKGPHLMRVIHGQLLGHLKGQSTILFPELSINGDVNNISARECGWCIQILKRRTVSTEWPKIFEPAHKENGMALSLLTKKSLDSFLYKGSTTTDDVLFIAPTKVNLAGKISGFPRVQGLPFFSEDVANLLHPCFAEWFMDMVGIRRISSSDPQAIIDCIGDIDPLYREPGVVVSCVGSPWNTAPALTAYEAADLRMNRPPSPDPPPLSIFSSSFRADPSPVVDLTEDEEVVESTPPPAGSTLRYDPSLGHRFSANTFLANQRRESESPEPMDVDVELQPSITNDEPDSTNDDLANQSRESESPDPMHLDVELQPPITNEESDAEESERPNDSSLAIPRIRPRDEFSKERIGRILSSCLRDIPFNASNRIVIKGQDVPSVANAIIALLLIASRYKMTNASGSVEPPLLKGIFSIEGPFWHIMSYPLAETHVLIGLHPVTGRREFSHGIGVYINVLSFAVSKVIANEENRYMHLPNDSPLKTPFFADENPPLHHSCIRHLSEGLLFALLILVSEGNADLSPLNPFLVILLAAGRGKETSALDNITASIIETLDPLVYEIMEQYLKLKRGQRMVDTSNRHRIGNHMLDPVAQLLMNYGGGIPVRLQDCTRSDDLEQADVYHRRILKGVLMAQPNLLISPNFISMQEGFQCFSSYTQERGFQTVPFFTSLFDRRIERVWKDIETVLDSFTYKGTGSKGSREAGDFMDAMNFAEVVFRDKVEEYILSGEDLDKAISRTKDVLVAATGSELIPMKPVSFCINSYSEVKMGIKAQVCHRQFMIQYSDSLEDISYGDYSDLPQDAYGIHPQDKVGFELWFGIQMTSLACDARKGLFTRL